MSSTVGYDSLLPVELWDAIVAEIDEEKPTKENQTSASFLACSLVCKRWTRYQAYVFKSVHLRDEVTWAKFAHVSQGSPHLAGYVQVLTAIPAKTRDWTEKENMILACLQNGIRSLHIGNIDWKSISSALVDAFTRVLGCGTLIHVMLSQVNFLFTWDVLDLLVHASQVKSLGLDTITFSEGPIEGDYFPEPLIHRASIESFEFTKAQFDENSSLSQLSQPLFGDTAPFIWDKLRSLTLGLVKGNQDNVADLRIVQGLLNKSGKALKHLAFRQPREPTRRMGGYLGPAPTISLAAFPLPLSLEANTNIEHLEFKSLLYPGRPWASASLQWIMDLLTYVQDIHRVKRVKITVNLDIYDEEDTHPNWTQWNQVDHDLDAPTFSHLERVELIIMRHVSRLSRVPFSGMGMADARPPASPDKWATGEHITRQFTRCAARGILFATQTDNIDEEYSARNRLNRACAARMH